MNLLKRYIVTWVNMVIYMRFKKGEKKAKDLKRLWSEQIEKKVMEFVVYCYQILEGKIR